RPAPRVVTMLPVSVTSDAGASRERAARAFGFYDQLPSYKAMLDREGASGPADVAVIGDEDEVAGALRHLVEIGATELAAAVFGSSEERTRTMALLGQLASEG
ncbi:MAG: LLM class F420-dependent oxidoreductase, partial [Acidimicrobiaceae bacterium]|nr:LLM class F420-dependent oxidoreductase [Acidimicrobiaceae bacterium]